MVEKILSLVNMKKILPYMYVAPAFLLVAFLLLFSVFFTIYISLTEWNLITSPNWVGLQQYIRLFSERTFMRSFFNTILWTVSMLFISVPLGLFLAIVLSKSPAERFTKILFYVPRIIAPTAIGVIWVFIYSTGGALDSTLETLGMASFIRPWLMEVPTNTVAMIFTVIWKDVGWVMVMFLVGLHTISPELIEAAKLEGASEWQIARFIKIPLLKPMAVIVITMTFLSTFKVFDIIWVMTRGGPYRSSETLAVTMYRGGFVLFNMGYAAAIAVVMSLIVFLFSIFYLRNITNV